jgi:hypothetical protein
MKKVSYTILILVAVSAMALALRPAAAAGESGTITGAGHGSFARGTLLGSIAVSSIDFGTGVFVEQDGSAGGPFSALLIGRSLLGQTLQITIDGNVSKGSVASAGQAIFSGVATVNLGDGTPSISGVPFSVTTTSDKLSLTLNSTALPAAQLTAGEVVVQ